VEVFDDETDVTLSVPERIGEFEAGLACDEEALARAFSFGFGVPALATAFSFSFGVPALARAGTGVEM
jgi:hypothetical protein